MSRNLVPPSARYVAGFLFHGDDVLLIRKAKPAWQRGKLNGPGGHVEPGETFLDAMIREYKEETGLEITWWEHFVSLMGEIVETSTSGPGRPFVVEFFRAEIGTDVPRPIVTAEEGHGEPLEWHHMRHLAEVLPNLRWLIPMAYQAHRVDWPMLVVEQKGDGRAISIPSSAYHGT